MTNQEIPMKEKELKAFVKENGWYVPSIHDSKIIKVINK